MQKKAGQISSNTLGLRFMQNAAKAKQEKEAEAAKAKVRSEEEWEVPLSVRQSWGIDDQGTEGQRVIYEQSYLPFLFAGFSSVPLTAEGEEEDVEDSPRIPFKGRRTFGKHGEEDVEMLAPESSQPLTSTSPTTLPRGVRTISSHGRKTTTSKSKPPQPPAPLPQRRPPGPQQPTVDSSGFMKPQIDVPRAQKEDRKRPLTGGGEGQRKVKRRKEKETFDLNSGS